MPGMASAADASIGRDPRMRDRAAQDRGMQHAFDGKIISEIAGSRQEARILHALDRAADQEFGDIAHCAASHCTSP
jgi:hypothetical protein